MNVSRFGFGTQAQRAQYIYTWGRVIGSKIQLNQLDLLPIRTHHNGYKWRQKYPVALLPPRLIFIFYFSRTQKLYKDSPLSRLSSTLFKVRDPTTCSICSSIISCLDAYFSGSRLQITLVEYQYLLRFFRGGPLYYLNDIQQLRPIYSTYPPNTWDISSYDGMW